MENGEFLYSVAVGDNNGTTYNIHSEFGFESVIEAKLSLGDTYTILETLVEVDLEGMLDDLYQLTQKEEN